jgi:hypothetical protein
LNAKLAIRHQDQGNHTMAKKRKAAAKRAARKPVRRSRPAKRRGSNPDATVNAVIILVVIVIALASAFFYLQKAKAEPAPINLSPAAISLEKK